MARDVVADIKLRLRRGDQIVASRMEVKALLETVEAAKEVCDKSRWSLIREHVIQEHLAPALARLYAGPSGDA